jgi:cytochrome c biogenesis protein CcmG/thiol:disulfide interchange protein DsbE
MTKADGIRIGAVALLVGVALFATLKTRTQSRVPISVGEYAPDFTLPALALSSGDAGPINLRQHRGQVVLVNFWATWCAPCVEETPSLQALSVKLRKMGVEVIGVSVDQDESALEKFAVANHLSFPIARDPDQVTAAMFGTHMFPETYILDRDGRVAEKIIGARDWQDPLMVTFLESLANPGQAPKD